jgi:hypothetical protein
MDFMEPPGIEPPEVTLRIPGTWSDPEEFYSRLPRGCRCTAESLLLADGIEFELHALPADDDFPQIFASSCPKLPTDEERDEIDNFTVNICISGKCGSIEAAKQLMTGAAAILEAGGAGVFVDNSGLAHGATDWQSLNDGADDGGVYWAFVTTVRAEKELYSIGMHILGFRDAIIPRTDDEERDYRAIHSFLGYSAFSGAQLSDGDMIRDAQLPSFRVYAQPDDRIPENAPMFNPYGRWRMEPVNATLN